MGDEGQGQKRKTIAANAQRARENSEAAVGPIFCWLPLE
jgi:hypothetical protein